MKAILVRYRGPTETRGGRFEASAEGVKSVSVSSAHGESHRDAQDEAVRRLCAAQDWSGPLVTGSLPDGSVAYVFADDRRIVVGEGGVLLGPPPC